MQRSGYLTREHDQANGQQGLLSVTHVDVDYNVSPSLQGLMQPKLYYCWAKGVSRRAVVLMLDAK